MTELILDRTQAEPYQAKPLDPQQLKVVAHRIGAMRVLAGPGTGKTTTLVAAMAERLTGTDKLKPENVLGLTFGRRAALDWRAKVTLAVGGGLVPQVSTFHSFCYGLLRKYDPQAAAEIGLRLLSGPEQQVRVRELFLGALEDGSFALPNELQAAAQTRGLIEEVRAVMSRTRSHLMDPQDLVELGRKANRPMWELIGNFMETYLQSIEAEQALDYAEVIFRAHLLVKSKDHVALELQDQYRAIFVDEYQDTDPGQVALLQLLVNANTTLTVVGDVDQAIYSFRGADESGIRNFAQDFAHIYGANIQDDISLNTCRRFGANLRNAAKSVIEKHHPAGFSFDLINTHRNLQCESDGGDIELLTYDSDGAQAAHIANLVARAHAQDGLAWSDIAVIVRSAANSIPTIYRALVAAGIPVEVAADEIPLHRDPASAPLIQILEVIAKPNSLTPELAVAIATGPIGQIDAVDLRRFVQYLRKADSAPERVARPSGELLIEAINNVGDLLAINEPRHKKVIDNVTRIGNLINECRREISKGASAHEILWQVWQSSTWPTQLLAASLGQGASAGRANRDLDSICSLFDQANRFVGQNRSLGVRVFLDEITAQEIPAEALADNQVRSNTVRILTAHRAKGLEWPLVIVAGVQEDLWPDLRMRQTLLQADRVGNNIELLPTTLAEALVAERRLFYVALTRAMQRVVVTAVFEDRKEEGEVPSRFIDDVRLSGAIVTSEHLPGRPARALSADSIVAELRRTLASPTSSEPLQKAAASRLAKLAGTEFAALRTANPDNWWGILPTTKNELNKPVEPISISATAINNLEECPAQWFLTRQVSAVAQTQNHMVFGTILHSIAQGLQTGELAPNLDDISGELDKVWASMPYEANWISTNERQEAALAAERLLNWFQANADVRSIAESTLEFATTLPVTDSDGSTREISIKITGSADRVQFNADDIVVYDYKTGRKATTNIQKNVQLALYSYLVENGTFSDGDNKLTLPPGQTVTGGALINLRLEDKSQPGMPQIQQVANGTHDLKNDVPLVERLANAAAIILDERYEARPDTGRCDYCAVRMLCPAQSEGRQVL